MYEIEKEAWSCRGRARKAVFQKKGCLNHISIHLPLLYKYLFKKLAKTRMNGVRDRERGPFSWRRLRNLIFTSTFNTTNGINTLTQSMGSNICSKNSQEVFKAMNWYLFNNTLTRFTFGKRHGFILVKLLWVEG